MTKTTKATVISCLNKKYDDVAIDDHLNMVSLDDPHFKTHSIKDDKVQVVISKAYHK